MKSFLSTSYFFVIYGAFKTSQKNNGEGSKQRGSVTENSNQVKTQLKKVENITKVKTDDVTDRSG